MRTLSRAQDVVSTIVCWRSRRASAGADFGAKWGEVFTEHALQPAHEPYRHTGILPRAAVVLPSLSEFSPSYKTWYRNTGATSLSPVAAGNQVLLWWAGLRLAS